MFLEDFLGPDALELLNKARPPSLGLPLVPFPPGGRPDRMQERLDNADPVTGRMRRLRYQSPGAGTEMASMVRSSGLPGQDRAPGPGKAAERDNPQGFVLCSQPCFQPEGF